MRAVTWHGRADVRVDTVPDPVIQEPTDVIIEVTSHGICGSDLHLIEVMAPFMSVGDVMGHEPMGIVREVGSEVTAVKAGDRVVVPFNISCNTCWMCSQGLQSQCETTQNREQGFGASLFGYTKLYGQVPGGQAEYLRVPFGNTLPIKVPDAPADDRFVYLSDVLPTAWQAVQYAGIPQGDSVLVLGLGPIGDMSTRIAQHLGADQVFAADVVPERLARARARGVTVIDSTAQEDVVVGGPGRHRRPRPGRRHRRRRHGGARLPARVLRAEGHGDRAGRDHGEGHAGGGRRPDGGAQHRHRGGPPGRHDLAVGRLRRGHRPDAAEPHVRQADPAAHGAGQCLALGARHPAAADSRATRSVWTTSPRTGFRSRRPRRRT